MFNRLRVVGLSYIYSITNRVCVLLAIAVFGMAIIKTHEPHFRSVRPEPRPWWPTILNADWPHNRPDFSPAKDGIEPTAWDWSRFDADADCVYVHTGPSIPWDRLKAMPKLRQLHLENYTQSGSEFDPELSADEFGRVGELTQLEYLSLPKRRYTSTDLGVLSSLRQLMHLNVGPCLLDEIELLPRLDEIHTLEIRSQQLTQAGAAHLHNYPKLETVILHDGEHGSEPPKRFIAATDEQVLAIEALAQLPNLKTIYVPGREYSDLEPFTIASLPQCSVRPLRVDMERHTTVLISAIGALCLCSAVIFAFIGHCSRAEAMLAPGYQWPHTLVAAGLIALAIGVATAVCCSVGFYGPSCCGIFAITMAIACRLFRLTARRRAWSFIVWIPFFIVLQFAPVQIFMRALWYGDIQWFGPVATVIGVIGIWSWFRDMHRTYRHLTELGLPTPVLTRADFGAVHLAQIAKASKRKGKQHKSTLMQPTPTDDQVAAIAGEFHGHRVNERRRLFQLPNGSQFKMTVGLISLYIMFQVAAVCYRFWTSAPVPPIAQIIGVVYFLFITSVMVSSFWSQRKGLLNYELCRPINRRNFVNDMFVVTFWDTLRLPIAAAGACMVGMLIQQPTIEGLCWVSVIAIWVLGLGLLHHATIVWWLSIATSWIASAVFLTSAAVTVGSVVMIVFISDAAPKLAATPGAVLETGVALLVLAAGMLWQGWYRWLGLELAELK